MKPDSIAFALAGAVFGLVAGWVIGSQYATTRAVPVASVSAPAAAPAAPAQPPTPPPLDEAAVARLRGEADANPASATPRVALANLYFDAERYSDAVTWYEAALKLDARNADVSTDLGVSYYYMNQPDRALEQFAHSLSVNPRHTKTMLNLGIVRAFGKQDLEGASKAWEQVVAIAPASPEGLAAKRALDAMRNAHPNVATQPGT
jgi:cytochrome c-type biogenesis protein CcmH/NrfG